LRCLNKANTNIAGHVEFNSPHSMQRFKGTQSTQAAIGGCRSAKANHNFFGARLERSREQFTGSKCGGCHGIVVFGPANKAKARGKRHLDDCAAPNKSPSRLDWIP
jgi:hypothetical protein